MVTSKKQITFDIDKKSLKEYYPETNWQQAYKDITEFMEANSFEQLQGSMYISTIPMSSIKVTSIIKKIIETYPWLNKCVKNCTMTEIGETYHYTKDDFAKIT